MKQSNILDPGSPMMAMPEPGNTEAPVLVQLANLNRIVGEMGEVVAQLERRLVPVLPEDPRVSAEREHEAPQGSPVCVRIQEAALGVIAMKERLVGLMQSLEI